MPEPTSNADPGTSADGSADAGGHAPWRSAWPAYLCAAGFLAYAGMKATYAVQGKLGMPFGEEVPQSAYDELGHVSLRQGTLAAMGAGAALLALASVQGWGRRIPRWLMLTLMWGALVPSAAGVPFVVHRVVTGPEPLGQRILIGAQSFAGLALWAAATVSYQRRSRQWRRG
jgi:hypothetical protein